MKYEEEFKASVVRDLRSSGESASAVARRHDIAPSTLVRWDARFNSSEEPGQEHEPGATQSAREFSDLLKRLDRADQESALERRIARHNRRVSLVGRYTTWAGTILAVAMIAVLGWGYYDLYTHSQDSVRLYVLWTVLVIFAVWLVSAVLDFIAARVANLFGGAFTFATVRLFEAQSILAQDTAGALVDPHLWHVSARHRRRRVRSNLRKAETALMQRTLLGRGFQTASAREWELAQRRKVAATIGYVETALELEGFRAYDRAGYLIRQVAYLTLIRDWTLEDLPTLPEVSPRYQSPFRRAVSRLWAPVPVLAAFTAVVLAIPEIIKFLRNLALGT